VTFINSETGRILPALTIAASIPASVARCRNIELAPVVAVQTKGNIRNSQNDVTTGSSCIRRMAVIVALALALSSSMPVEMVPKDQRRFRGWDAEFDRSVIGACDRKLCSAVRAIPLHQSKHHHPCTIPLRANSNTFKTGFPIFIVRGVQQALTTSTSPVHFFPFRGVQHQRQRRICHNAGHQFPAYLGRRRAPRNRR